jgi:hypothetical protein
VAFLIRPGWLDNGLVCRVRFLFASVLYLPMAIIIIIIIIIIRVRARARAHTHPNQYVNKLIHCCGIKG